MVIDDSLLRNMTRSAIDQVFAPKMLGALLLDKFSRTCELDFFVMYSSATTVFGNPGQGNYVAANHFLESLAARRRQLGLPGLAIAWGAIADVGFLARNDAVRDALQSRMGGTALASATALDELERLLAPGTPAAVGVLELDWPSLSRFLPGAQSPRFREVARQVSRDSEAGDGAELQRWLRELPPAELQAAVADLLKAEVGEILRLAPEKIDSQKSLYELGLDSLMAVELITAVDQRFGINLPVMAISEGPTIARIADRLILQLTGGEAAADAGEAGMAAQVRVLAGQHGGTIDNETLDRVASSVGGKAG
jgi:acyl carrier protein